MDDIVEIRQSSEGMKQLQVEKSDQQGKIDASDEKGKIDADEAKQDEAKQDEVDGKPPPSLHRIDDDFTPRELAFMKKMYMEYERGKKVGPKTGRAPSRSTTSSSNSEPKKRRSNQAPAKNQPPKKMKVDKIRRPRILKPLVEEKRAVERKDEYEFLEEDYEGQLEDEDGSDDPDDDELISLGEDENDYQRRKKQRRIRALKAVPLALLRRAQVLKIPRNAYFIHFCADCKSAHFKREEGILFKTDQEDTNILPIKLCLECLNSNIQLNVSYTRHWNQEQVIVENDDEISYVFRGENITGAGDEKLLNLKYVWCLHQCQKCSLKQKTLADDVFLEKSGNVYELNFLVCRYCTVANRDIQMSINRLFSSFGNAKK